MKLLLAVTLLAPFLFGQEQQPPAAPANPKDPAKLSGRVASLTTGEPVRKVNLTLRPMDASKQPYAAASDAEGRFAFPEVEPGTYRLSAEKTGYVRQEYGAKRSVFFGTPLTLGAGQEMKDIAFKLTPQAVISGKVLDEDGDPMAAVQIMILRYGFSQGKRRLLPNGGSMSNDTGEFRAANLPPGRYYLMASYMRPQMMMGGEAPAHAAANKPEEGYVTTYYPGAADESGASPIEISPGQELTGINIQLRKSRVFRIRGKVVGASGANLRVSLAPRQHDAFSMPFFGGAGTMVRKQDNQEIFEITNVKPGSYIVILSKMEGMMSVLGRAPVDVGEENVDNLAVTVQPPLELQGVIKVEGDRESKVEVQRTRVMLMPMDGMGFSAPNSAVKEDGAFTLSNVSRDRYRVTAVNQTEGVYVKSVRLGNQEVLDSGLDLSEGGAGALVVTLSTAAAQIEGTVQDDKGQNASGVIVTLIPDPPNPDKSQLYRTNNTDQAGHFVMKGIAPGSYRVYAWEDLEQGAQMDPEFLKAHESKGVKVKVEEKGREQIQLTTIPADAAKGAK